MEYAVTQSGNVLHISGDLEYGTVRQAISYIEKMVDGSSGETRILIESSNGDGSNGWLAASFVSEVIANKGFGGRIRTVAGKMVDCSSLMLFLSGQDRLVNSDSSFLIHPPRVLARPGDGRRYVTLQEVVETLHGYNVGNIGCFCNNEIVLGLLRMIRAIDGISSAEYLATLVPLFELGIHVCSSRGFVVKYLNEVIRATEDAKRASIEMIRRNTRLCPKAASCFFDQARLLTADEALSIGIATGFLAEGVSTS
ncbi:hypothetical protein HGA64_03190 [Candidatus Falkowbacteria bacterium]|nr:hypothetical protein [Candidatus Falkowbacteria bacterium]